MIYLLGYIGKRLERLEHWSLRLTQSGAASLKIGAEPLEGADPEGSISARADRADRSIRTFGARHEGDA